MTRLQKMEAKVEERRRACEDDQNADSAKCSSMLTSLQQDGDEADGELKAAGGESLAPSLCGARGAAARRRRRGRRGRVARRRGRDQRDVPLERDDRRGPAARLEVRAGDRRHRRGRDEQAQRAQGRGGRRRRERQAPHGPAQARREEAGAPQVRAAAAVEPRALRHARGQRADVRGAARRRRRQRAERGRQHAQQRVEPRAVAHPAAGAGDEPAPAALVLVRAHLAAERREDVQALRARLPLVPPVCVHVLVRALQVLPARLGGRAALPAAARRRDLRQDAQPALAREPQGLLLQVLPVPARERRLLRLLLPVPGQPPPVHARVQAHPVQGGRADAHRHDRVAELGAGAAPPALPRRCRRGRGRWRRRRRHAADAAAGQEKGGGRRRRRRGRRRGRAAATRPRRPRPRRRSASRAS